MIITLSPSKGQDFESESYSETHSQPRSLQDSQQLIIAARLLNTEDIKSLMKVSDAIAELNVSRFVAFSQPFSMANAKQAFYAFKGDVYSAIDTVSYSEADLGFAQKHVRILSGLYGCLRPLDLIQAYRLEMKTKLATTRGENLYQFWGEKITDLLNHDLAEAVVQGVEPVLVNLASNEYYKSVQTKRINGRILNINFKEINDGKARIIAIFAKKARGMMVDYIVKNAITDVEHLKGFDYAGYRYSSENSDHAQWTFTRPQPPKKT